MTIAVGDKLPAATFKIRTPDGLSDVTTDELFAGTYGQFEKLTAQFPESHTFHNGLAWLAGKTNRRMDEALAHARRAVQLAPDNAAVIDTLARVHHVRGEHDQAITHARRCLELVPTSASFRKQVAEFEAAAGK